jgi:hypothetical protein
VAWTRIHCFQRIESMIFSHGALKVDLVPSNHTSIQPQNAEANKVFSSRQLPLRFIMYLVVPGMTLFLHSLKYSSTASVHHRA